MKCHSLIKFTFLPLIGFSQSEEMKDSKDYSNLRYTTTESMSSTEQFMQKEFSQINSSNLKDSWKSKWIKARRSKIDDGMILLKTFNEQVAKQCIRKHAVSINKSFNEKRSPYFLYNKGAVE